MTSTGFFRKALDTIVAGRQRQANRQVNRYLLTLSDDMLKDYGYSRDNLKKVVERF